jgi:hypothetical protein
MNGLPDDLTRKAYGCIPSLEKAVLRYFPQYKGCDDIRELPGGGFVSVLPRRYQDDGPSHCSCGNGYNAFSDGGCSYYVGASMSWTSAFVGDLIKAAAYWGDD